MPVHFDRERFVGDVKEEVLTKNAAKITSLVGNSPGTPSDPAGWVSPEGGLSQVYHKHLKFQPKGSMPLKMGLLLRELSLETQSIHYTA